MITTSGPLPKVARVEIEEVVADIYGDRWYKFSGSAFYKNVDQDDDHLTRHDLEDRYGPLTVLPRYRVARGAVPVPEGAPDAVDAIRASR